MPTQASTRTFAAPMPTFMSVFGEESNREGTVVISPSNHGDVLRPATAGNILRSPATSANTPFSIFHQHRGSTSTSASESADSSPTTTISTIDSASMTEPSPGASPESPVTKASPSSFVPDFRSRNVGGASDAGPTPFFELQRPTTPAKKARNLKNLAVNTASSLSLHRAVSSGTLPSLANQLESAATSAPVSPSFVKPPTPPKRRPSNLALTLQISANSNLPTRLTIPPTPTFKRPSLRHFQSSPSLPLCTNLSKEGSSGPPLQPIRTFKPNPHGFAEIPLEDEEEDQEPNFDVPQSREEKPQAYPNGPICIYESGVYLYYEPTAEQASKFDVILNVASEVKNPFTVTTTTTAAADETADQASERMEIDAGRRKSEPAVTVDATSGNTNSTAEQSNTPTTPKANAQPNGCFVQNMPEYIHIPWEHNTDIVPDLYKLVKIIEDRVQKKKRVLVHCQCGVSRSASLIVAYGLYKNPGITVQEAYDAVKKRSKWIGPNMNLIMQLQEFRSGLLKANGDRAVHNQVYGTRKSLSMLSPGMSADGRRHSPFEADESTGSRTPRTAPLPPEPSAEQASLRASTGNMEAVSAGPFAAPWSPTFRRSWAASSQTNYDLPPPIAASFAPNEAPLIDANGHLVPVPSMAQANFSEINDRVDSGTSESIELELKVAAQREMDTQSDHTVQVADEPKSEEVSPGRPSSRVPNFSRQLPLRLDGEVDGQSPLSEPILSPRAEEFHMTALRKESYDDVYGILSPHNAGLNLPVVRPPTIEESIISPGFGSFPKDPFLHKPAPLRAFNRADRGLMSPGLGGGFPKDPFTLNLPPQNPEAFGLFSPGIGGGFPKDPFGGPPTPVASDLASPRSEEFHMTALQAPAAPNDDPFGLTSPRDSGDFHQASFDGMLGPDTLKERHTTLPQHVHPILPPPELNTHGAIEERLAMCAKESSILPSDMPIFGSLSTTPTPGDPFPAPPKPQAIPQPEVRSPSPVSDVSPEQSPQRLTIPKPSSRSIYLTTPPRQPSLRTRFSSPNMSQQRRLHKLQTEIETRLMPARQPGQTPPTQSQDDLDALMSPRATEFTKNPFHLDIPTETPISRPHGFDFGFAAGAIQKRAASWSTKTAQEDPRSPVLTGGSPIVRNIWDVL